MPNKTTKIILICTLLLTMTACSNMSNRNQRMVSGAAIGTGVGAAAGAVTGGCITCGAVIGAGVGTAAGALYDNKN